MSYQLPPQPTQRQGKVKSYYLDFASLAIITAESQRTGDAESVTLRRIVAEWQATQIKIAEYEKMLEAAE